MAESNNSIPLIVFIPVIVCCVAIAILLQYRNSTRNEQLNEADAIAIAQSYEDLDTNNIENEDFPEDVEDSLSDNDNDPQEGTSTAVRVKKIGKKRAEKLKRKEHMRQYREYLDHQREARRYTDQIEEERFRQRKIAESIQREKEHEKRIKAQMLQQKKLDGEKQQKEKSEEKERKRLQNILQKYKEKIKRIVQEKKFTNIEDLSSSVRLTSDDILYVLKHLLEKDEQFRLSLLADDSTSFLYVTKEDYARLDDYMQKTGYLKIESVAAEKITSILIE